MAISFKKTVFTFKQHPPMSLSSLLPLLCSAAFGTLLTLFATRKKTNAETQLFNTEIYSTMLGDLRAQLNLQGEQLKNQAQQILNLQKKETENVRIINQQRKREREHLGKIKQLEATIRQMESRINHLQYQLYGKQS